MNNRSLDVLLIEDDKVDQMAFERLVKGESLPYNYTIAESTSEAKKLLDSKRFDIIIADYLLRDGTAFDIFDSIVGTPIVFVTGAGNEEAAVKAMKAGAYDYFLKDPDRNYLKILPVTVENAIRHKKAEEQARIVSHAIMNSNDSVYITDMNDNIIFINKAFCNTYGYDEKEILGKKSEDILKIYSPKDNGNRAIDRRVRRYWRGECYHRQKDGTKFPVFLTRSVIKDENGNEVAVVGISTDITESKEAAEKLRESKEKYHNLFDSAADVNVVIDPEGNLLDLNKKFEEESGYRREEMIGKNVFSCGIVTEKSVGTILTQLKRLLAGKPYSTIEIEGVRKDGELIPYELQGVPIKKGTEIVGIQATLRNITKRKQAEKELHRVSRAQKTMSEANMALVRATDELDLLNDVCRILVEVGEYHLAWVGFLEENGENGIYVVAKAGCEERYKRLSWKDAKRNCNAVDEAIRSGKPYIVKNFKAEPDGIPWCCREFKQGRGSSISLPLMSEDGCAIGALSILSMELEAFDVEEVRLLKELADDLAFGLRVLRTRDARKQAERTLQESEEKYRTLTENINAGIFRITPGRKGQFIEVNPALLQMFGYDNKEDFLKINVDAYYQSPEDMKKFDQKMVTDGFVKDEEYLLKKKDGTVIWCSVTAVAVRDKNDRIEYYDGVVKDITERKEMEEEIERRKQYLESVLYNAPDAIVTLDASQCIIEWNPGAEQIFGYTSDEVLGKNIDDLIINPETREEAAAFTKQVLSGGKLLPTETVRYRKDGTPVNVIVAGSPIRIGDELHGVVAVYSDITPLKQTEKELYRIYRALKTLSESNKALIRATEEQALLNNVCDILIKVGGYRLAWVGFAEQDDEKSICPVSKAGCDEGYLEAVKFTWQDTKGTQSPVGSTVRTGKLCIVKNCIEGSEDIPWRSEAAGRGYASSISLPLRDNGFTFGALNIYAAESDAFDVEEVKLLKELAEDLSFGIMVLRAREAHRKAEEEKERMQTQLLQAQKMEAVGILSGGIAHDFNNLLTAILGCADMAMIGVEEKDPVYKDLEEIQYTARRAANLTRQLLLFSRKRPMRFSLVILNQTIKDLLKMLGRLIGEDIEIITDLASDLWTVQADKGTIEQMIMNLAVNARDAMPEGGRLTIKSENVSLEEAHCKGMPEAQPGKYVRLSVSDTGVGIDSKTVQRVFEPFFSTKGLGEGTGLGLSVVYGIVKQHEGWIHVNSEPGRGSTFEVYLPMVSEKVEEKKKESISLEKPCGEGKRILVVEDEERVLEFTISGLDRSGYHVFAAANAGEAKKIFKKEKGNFNLVMSDVVLPDESGIELVDEFVSQKPDLAVLLSSGYTDHKSRWPVIQKRGYHFLEKPYTLNDLLCAVQDLAA